MKENYFFKLQPFIILFLIANTLYFWGGNLGFWEMLLFCVLMICYFILWGVASM